MPKQTITEERQALLNEAESKIGEARDALQSLFDDLDKKRANMGEKFSTTERYGRFEEACEALEEAISALNDVDLDIELP